MPQMPMMSARGAGGRDSRFSSTISTFQSGGQNAANVARPSGGFIARLPDNILSRAHLKLQKLSLNLGFMRSKRMVGQTPASSAPGDRFQRSPPRSRAH